MIHFECESFSSNPHVAPLVFDWDELAGTVSGPGAADILRRAATGFVPAHPMPGSHRFSDSPLKNRADMAAIIGYQHRLPAELMDDYPVVADDLELVQTLDASGNVIDVQELIY